MAKNRKRKRTAADASSGGPTATNLMGIGSTLSVLRNPDLPTFNLTTGQTATIESSPIDQRGTGQEEKPEWQSEEWQTVRTQRSYKSRKLEKKELSKYPGFEHSPHAKLQAAVKLSDLQNLVLYLLADGPAPQWISVRNHAVIKKVVVVMIPGLERAMFDGGIAMGTKEDAAGDAAEISRASGDERPVNGSHDTPDGEAQIKSFSDVRSGSEPHPSPDDYLPVELRQEKLPKPLQPLASVFPQVWPVRTPGDDRYSRMHSPIQAILNAPIPKSKDEKQQTGARPPREARVWENQRTPITSFLASAEQLRENDFPLHHALGGSPQELADETKRRQRLGLPKDGWQDTWVDDLEAGTASPDKVNEGSMTVGREVLAMDCEMCLVEGGHSRLARVSLVGWDGGVVLDELIKPAEPIIDYLTPFSGMTQAMLDPVKTTLADIQKRLQNVIHPRVILVGHSLESDLAALRMTHPFIVDTSLIYPHPRGPPLKSSLKWLAQKYLGREIQRGHGTSGHNSIEDAKACLDLVRQKCEKGPKWGTSDASSESVFKRLSRGAQSSGDSTTSNDGDGKTGAVVDWGQPQKSFGALAKVCIGCQSDDDVARGVRDAVNGDEDGKTVSGGGVDFVWARLRELEALRGWWNQNRQPGQSADDGIADPDASVSAERLGEAVSRTVDQIRSIFESLPPCTAFLVYSGSGDPREMSRLHAMQQQFRQEYKSKKWDELSVQWTDTEDQQLRAATKRARQGIGFMTVK